MVSVMTAKLEGRSIRSSPTSSRRTAAWKLVVALGVALFGVGLVRLSQSSESQLYWESLELANHDQFHLPRIMPSSSSSAEAAAMSNRLPKLPVIPKPDPFPPRSQIMETLKQAANETNDDATANKVAGQFILDLAIVGFAKCGTSTMMSWLGQHPEITIPPYEIPILLNKEPWDLVNELYPRNDDDANRIIIDPNPKLLRGYKNPSDIIGARPLRLLREFFPQTKLIIGIRHPIRMMESFYNHRVQNQFQIVPFTSLQYFNVANAYGVSFSRAEYHIHLAKLGLTNVAHNTTEQSLFPSWWVEAMQTKQQQQQASSNTATVPPTIITPQPNPIFLYDTAQLSDSNTTRLEGFLQDLQHFLGLTQPLPTPLHEKPGRKYKTTKTQRTIDNKKIDICEARYKKQRRTIKLMGAQAKSWILEYFLSSPTVYVSNEDHFRVIVGTYGENPCLSDAAAAAAAAAGGRVDQEGRHLQARNSSTTREESLSSSSLPVGDETVPFVTF